MHVECGSLLSPPQRTNANPAPAIYRLSACTEKRQSDCVFRRTGEFFFGCCYCAYDLCGRSVGCGGGGTVSKLLLLSIRPGRGLFMDTFHRTYGCPKQFANNCLWMPLPWMFFLLEAEHWEIWLNTLPSNSLRILCSKMFLWSFVCTAGCSRYWKHMYTIYVYLCCVVDL